MKAERWLDGYITISEASRLTGKTRETIAKTARELPVRDGPGNAKSYRAQELLQRLYIGSDGTPTVSESMRQLNVARKAQIDLDMQVKRRERIPLEIVNSVSNEIDMADCGDSQGQRRQSSDTRSHQRNLRAVPQHSRISRLDD